MDIKKIAYEKYRLDWMIAHGHSITELMKELELMRQEDPERSLLSLFEDWEYGYGFSSEVWACYDEFLETEYTDAAYMKALLTESEYELYSLEAWA